MTSWQRCITGAAENILPMVKTNKQLALRVVWWFSEETPGAPISLSENNQPPGWDQGISLQCSPGGCLLHLFLCMTWFSDDQAVPTEGRPQAEPKGLNTPREPPAFFSTCQSS
jgi:hypothetical protein